MLHSTIPEYKGNNVAELAISKLAISPIKSGTMVEVDALTLGPTGPVGDRSHMIVRPDGSGGYDMVSASSTPEVALLEVDIDFYANTLRLALAGQEAPPLPFLSEEDSDAPPTIVSIYGHEAKGYDCGGEIADWLEQRFIDLDFDSADWAGVRVLRQAPDHPRYMRDQYRRGEGTGRVGFADRSPLSMARQESLDAVNARRAAQGKAPVLEHQFRSNLWLAGGEEGAFAEDYWRGLLTEDDVALEAVRAILRCKVIERAPGTGKRGKGSVAKTLAELGRVGTDPTNGDEGVFFAEQLIYDASPGPLELKVGQRVVVTERSSVPNFVPRHQ